MRRRFILLKDTFELKKGAILEEACDEGTQDFILLSKDKAKFDTTNRNPEWYRELVINNPKWFEEVGLLWLTQKQIEKVKKLLKIK